MNRATAVRLLSLVIFAGGCQSQPPAQTQAPAVVGVPSSPDAGPPGRWQPSPDEEYFLGTYSAVHRPRIAIYVNPSLDGKLILPAQTVDSTVTYLGPGEYDQSLANAFDYAALQASLAVQMSCGGLVRIIPPEFLADHMTNQDQQDLVQGNPEVLTDMAGRTGADVLIQIQARPKEQTAEGLDLVVEAGAVDTRTGKTLGRAFVSMRLPVEDSLRGVSRSLAGKLMGQMAEHWAGQAGSYPLPPKG